MIQAPKYFMAVYSNDHMVGAQYSGKCIHCGINKIPYDLWNDPENITVHASTEIQNMFFIEDRLAKLNERFVEDVCYKMICQDGRFYDLQKQGYILYVKEISNILSSTPAISTV